ncbi:MAG: CheY-like chemotaxis protein [Paracoccaceae bacterium]|jgi:CheY-like chemotaxis protein
MNSLKKILHVDDDEDIRTIARYSLEQLGGFELLQCTCVTEAIQKAKEFMPDLLLLDMQLPDGTGATILDDLCKVQSLAGIPAIFLTGENATDVKGMAAHAQVAGFIQKPFDPISLPQEIRKSFQKHRC